MIASLFFPWARAAHELPAVPVNIRITPRPALCVRQEDIDAENLEILSEQLKSLEDRREITGAAYIAACKALDVWNTDNRDEFNKLTVELKK